MVYYVIPTMSHMEPFDGANKRLLHHTIDSIKKKFHRRIIVATDEDWGIDFVRDMRIKGMPIDVEGEASYRDVLLGVEEKMMLDPDDEFVMLSLEYPDRTYRNIRSCIQYYRKHEMAKSMMCKFSMNHPAEKFIVAEDEAKGRPVIEDKGQEWKEDQFDTESFLHSHFVTMHQVSELQNVNDWLWNEDTIFFPIETEVNRVRTKEELDEYESNNNT